MKNDEVEGLYIQELFYPNEMFIDCESNCFKKLMLNKKITKAWRSEYRYKYMFLLVVFVSLIILLGVCIYFLPILIFGQISNCLFYFDWNPIVIILIMGVLLFFYIMLLMKLLPTILDKIASCIDKYIRKDIEKDKSRREKHFLHYSSSVDNLDRAKKKECYFYVKKIAKRRLILPQLIITILLVLIIFSNLESCISFIKDISIQLWIVLSIVSICIQCLYDYLVVRILELMLTFSQIESFFLDNFI